MLRQHNFRIPLWFSRCAWTAVVCVACCWQTGWAAEPRRELWDLVQKDVGLAIEVRGLSEQSRKLIHSELFRRIQRHSAWQQVLRSGEVKHLLEIQQVIGEVTGQSLVAWLDKIFGQEVILTLTPQPQGRPRSLLLTRLAHRDDLPAILAAWEKLEPRTETRLKHREVAYFRRVKNDTNEALYYALIDDILVISDQADSLVPVIDLSLDEQHQNAVPRVPGFQKIAQALNPAAALRVLIQPGTWLALRSPEELADKPADPIGRWIRHLVEGCQAIGIGVRLESGVVAEVVAHSDKLGQHPEWLKIVQKTAGDPAFLSRVPNSAVLAVAGRHDLGDIADWILSHLSADQVKKSKSLRQVVRGFLLGNDLFDDVLPQLPADFGGYLIPRTELQVDSAPVDGLLAISIPSTDRGNGVESSKPTVRQAFENALSTGVSLVVSMHNSSAQKAASVEEGEHHGVTVHWVENVGPIQPAYAMAPDYFLAATSPQVIRDFLSQSPTSTWSADPGLRKLRESLIPEASQVVSLQGQMLKSFLVEQRGFLLKQLEATHKLHPEDAGRRLDRMLEWVQLSDRLILASSLHADHVKLVLAITVADPE